MSDPFLLSLVGHITDRIADRNYDLLFSTTRDFSAEQALSYIDSHKVDGLIVIGQGKNRSQMQTLASSKAPMVVWGAAVPGQHYVSVGSDNKYGGFLATEHLIKSGCRHIVFLGDTNHPEVEYRYQGYLEAHRKKHKNIEKQLFSRTAFCIESGFNQVGELIAQQQEFDGIVCASDMIALGCIKALHKAGLKVPQDISVIGFDDIPMAAYSSPSLTTVRQDIELGATLLVDKLFAQIAGKPATSTELKPELIIRNSCFKAAVARA